MDESLEESMSGDRISHFSNDLSRITQALISSGYTSLDEQAKALGVHRSTAWVIIKNKHKVGRLSAKTIHRILSNPQTPPHVRMLVQQYLEKRFERKLGRVSSLQAPKAR
jgi:hypothetical protein